MHRYLELHLAQLERAWEDSRTNVYSEPRKNRYHGQLEKLLVALREEKLHSLDFGDILEVKKTIDFFFVNLAYLNSATLNHIPFEITKCLEIALDEWLYDEKFIIVPSLSENFHDFYFDETLITTADYYEIIEARYNLTFDAKLIQITLPKSLSNDYLAAVVLYHELGHFIDVYFNISSILEYQIDTDEDLKNKLIDEKFLIEGVNYKRYCEEYFADVFAARYVGASLSDYLGYMTLESPGYSYEYPSLEKRQNMVNDFLSNKENPLSSLIRKTFKSSVLKDLEPLSSKQPIGSYINLLPEEVDDPELLHRLFPEIWSLWLGEWSTIESENAFGFQIEPKFFYELINNLTEKTISNHIISNAWAQIDVSYKE